MRAAVYEKYGPPEVVHIKDIPRPAPKPGEVLIRICASTVSSADWRGRSLEMPRGFGFLGRLVFGLFGPRQPVLGTELSGVIEAVGGNVTKFKPGDDVFAFTGAKLGCHAEYRTLGENGLMARKPLSLTHEEAAALSFGGTTALSFLRGKGNIKPGERVLVIGASGAVGSAAVQLARHFGAHVTGVCSTGNAGLVRSIGAHEVIDYTQEDFARSGGTWDIILDTTGTASYAKCGKSLNAGGRLLLVLASFAQTLGFGRAPKSSGRKVIAGIAAERLEDLQFLARLAEEGQFRPVIDGVFSLDGIVDAHRRVDSGRKRGSVVVRIGAAAPAQITFKTAS